MATIAAAALSFGVQVLLARVLGVEAFGAFSSSLAMVTLVAPLAGFGVAGYWLRLFGQEGVAAQRWLPASFRFLLLSTCLVVVAAFVWAWFGPHDELTAMLLMLLAIVVVGNLAVELGSAKYQLEGNHKGLALWQLMPHLLRFSGVAALLLLMGDDEFGAVQAAGVFAVVAVILLVLVVCQMLQLRRAEIVLEGHTKASEGPSGQARRNNEPSVGQVISGVWPFGLAGIFYLIYFQSDIILVKYLVDDVAAGYLQGRLCRDGSGVSFSQRCVPEVSAAQAPPLGLPRLRQARPDLPRREYRHAGVGCSGHADALAARTASAALAVRR